MQETRWDLTPLFSSKEELDGFLEENAKKVEFFEQNYSGKLGKLTASEFLRAIEEYESLSEEIAGAMTYAFLCFASDTKEGDFYAKIELKVNACEEHLLFFEVEFNKLSKDIQTRFINASSKYSYYLTLLAQNASHQLSLLEEKVLLKKEPTGVSAFSRLFDEYLSRLKFDLRGEKKSEEEVLSLLYDANRDLRKDAAKSLTDGLAPNLHLLSYIYNVVRKDLRITQQLRKYATIEEARHIANQTTQKSVDLMVDCINNNFSIVEDYYTIKAKLLGLEKIYDYDRYAPLPDSGNNETTYEEAQKLVLETFSSFSSTFEHIAKEAFANHWIDTHPRDNKRGGAFSHGSVARAHPYILLNFTNKRRDIFTLAHELGHTIHQQLSYNVGYLNADTPLTTAETASVFAEMLLFDNLKQKLQGKEKIALYAGKLEDIFATLFRQCVFTNFERRVHEIEDELKPENFSQMWLEENQRMFGNSVTLTDDYGIWWSYIPHFIHTPFYCYAYSYGQLLVLALFGLYKREGSSFVAKYEQFLSAGGSRSPKDLVGIFGMDLEGRDFWEIGILEVTKILGEFKEITQNLK